MIIRKKSHHFIHTFQSDRVNQVRVMKFHEKKILLEGWENVLSECVSERVR